MTIPLEFHSCQLIFGIGKQTLSYLSILNDFSSETIGPIVTKFHIQPRENLGKKSYSNGLGHMIKVAAIPIYGKNRKNILLQNLWTDDHET